MAREILCGILAGFIFVLVMWPQNAMKNVVVPIVKAYHIEMAR